MEKELFVRAEEVARELGISKPYAYKLVREMNEELKKKGFLTRSGRDEQALMTTIAGLVVVLVILIQRIADLFDLIRELFELG